VVCQRTNSQTGASATDVHPYISIIAELPLLWTQQTTWHRDFPNKRQKLWSRSSPYYVTRRFNTATTGIQHQTLFWASLTHFLITKFLDRHDHYILTCRVHSGWPNGASRGVRGPGPSNLCGPLDKICTSKRKIKLKQETCKLNITSSKL
jgi:hypothetical protein